MSIRLRWDDNDNNVLHQIFEEGWTLQAYYHSIEALEVMLNGRQHPVQLIMNLDGAKTPPMRFARGRTVDEAKATANVERIILVNPGYFMPVVNCPVAIVSTMDEAHAVLDDAQEKIPA
ncbi:MAG: hypothetical protein AAF653_02010 [Chloroflexota bacterium]